jgi:hypothetical protein
LWSSQRRARFFHDDSKGRESTILLDFIVLPLFEGCLLIRLEQADDFRQNIILNLPEFRSELRVCGRCGPSALPTASATLTRVAASIAALPSASLSGRSRLSSKTFDRVLNLLESSFNDGSDRAFLIARYVDIGLGEEFLHRVHRIGLLAAAAGTEISSAEEGGGQPSPAFILS